MITKGTKFDDGKPQPGQVDPEFILDLSEVLGHGADKYGDMNWTGLTIQRLLDAHDRHMLAFKMGEDVDPETGRYHTVHASSCLMMINWIKRYGEEQQDDRRFA